MKDIDSMRIVDCPYSKSHCTVIAWARGWQYSISWALPKPTEQEVREEIERKGFKHWIRS